jgi:hypothetical protein
MDVQTEPVRRTAALEVTTQGMNTRQVVVRFEAERQALAMMDHPAIAKVNDAGATPEGRPSFATEHVKGAPLTELTMQQTNPDFLISGGDMKRKFFLIALVLMLVLPVCALAMNWPDTGQTTCYDADGKVIGCPAEGEDFYGQDAQYQGPERSYTKLDANGHGLHDSAVAWTMVRDNVTGLIWEVKTDDGSVHDMDNLYTWYDPNPETNGGYAGTQGDGTDTEDFIDALNAESFGGFSDWRLPTIDELASLVHADRHEPAIDEAYFPNTVDFGYWSSTTLDDDDGLYAWAVLGWGGVGSTLKSGSLHVRAVRGGHEDSQALIDNGDGTVTDSETGLMWQQLSADAGTMTWQEALAYCEELSLAGYTDWRLPNLNELISIVDFSASRPSIDVDAFPDTVDDWYHSSTTGVAVPSSAWSVDFTFGGSNYSSISPKSFRKHVRAVRGGPGTPIYIPAAAHTPGLGDTNWRTDLQIKPRGAQPATVRIDLLERDRDNSSPTSVTVTVDPGVSVRSEDVLSGLFGFTGSAALRITATSGDVMVTSRTFNDDASGTYGQYIPGSEDSEAFGEGEHAALIQLSMSVDPEQGYRSNVGFLNVTGRSIDIEVSLYRSTGVHLGTLDYVLLPYEYDQVTNIFDAVSTANVEDGYALVRTTTSGGEFFTYASVVDNRSGDAIYIPGQQDQAVQ